MNINSSRNSLLRSRNLRSAKRARAGRVVSSRTSQSGSSSRTQSNSSTRRTNSTTSMTQTKQLAMYEKIEKSAYNIQVNVEKMLKIGKMSYTEDEAGKAAQESDKQNLMKGIEDFVSDFNEVYNDLCDIGGVSNLAYKKTLDSIVSANEGALKAIGITVSKSGELVIDQKTLENADLEKVKEVFAKEGGFAEKISKKMVNIEDGAANSLSTLSKLYGATSTYNKYGTSNSYFNNNGYYNFNYGNYGSNRGWYF
ncbi:MAG: hypothetical protein K2O40_10890 [Lachnospiraceae bacterium]|nr:hypothetical protein [Lachnospiraceae bacterium]